MFDIIIVELTICEHVMHIVLGCPPFKTESSTQRSKHSSYFLKGGISAMAHGVTHPTNYSLSKSKAEYAQYANGSEASSEESRSY